jgi:hypothetical protein
MFRSVPLALLATFAIGAIGAADASAALPEFIPNTGQVFPIHFTGKGGLVKFSDKAGLTFTCKHRTVTGEIDGLNGVHNATKSNELHKVVETYSECTECWTPGAGTGVIKTEPLKGKLGYISKTNKEVALEFEGEGEHPLQEPLWANIKCSSPFIGEGQIRGHLFGQIPAINDKGKEEFNHLISEFQLDMTAVSNGVQKITHFEGGLKNEQLEFIYGGTIKQLFAVEDSGYIETEKTIEILA